MALPDGTADSDSLILAAITLICFLEKSAFRSEAKLRHTEPYCPRGDKVSLPDADITPNGQSGVHYSFNEK